MDVIDDYLLNLAYHDLSCQSRGQGKSNKGPSPLKKLLIKFPRLIKRTIKLDKIVEEIDLVKNYKIIILGR